MAKAKEREPIVASAILSATLLVAAILPLVLSIYLIRAFGNREPEQDLTELLVYELTSEQSMLLPAPRQNRRARSLPRRSRAFRPASRKR